MHARTSLARLALDHVVIASDDDGCAGRADARVEPDERPMPGNRRSRDEAFHAASAGAPFALPDFDDGGGELAATRDLLERSDIGGRVIALDALHAVRGTAKPVTERCGAECLLTVKGNASETLETLGTIDRERNAAGSFAEGLDKVHGWLERRSTSVLTPPKAWSTALASARSPASPAAGIRRGRAPMTRDRTKRRPFISSPRLMREKRRRRSCNARPLSRRNRSFRSPAAFPAASSALRQRMTFVLQASSIRHRRSSTGPPRRAARPGGPGIPAPKSGGCPPPSRPAQSCSNSCNPENSELRFRKQLCSNASRTDMVI